MKNKLYLLLLVTVITMSCGSKKDSETTEVKKITSIESPAGASAEEPNLVKGLDGNLYMSWIERNEKMASLYFSKWEGEKWSNPEKIAEGDDWFVNWADYPAIAVNKSGDMIAHYLQKSDTGTYTYDVKLVAKRAFSDEWSAPIKLHSDTVNAEHGFVSMQPLEDDSFFLSWLDGRNTASNEGGHHGHGNGAMTIRAAVLDTDLTILSESELDSRVCDCCQTSAAVTTNGPIVTYRDRSEDEIRDMSIVRLVDGQWTSAQNIYADGWNIAGCPVNGPKTAAMENNLAIAWFSAPEGEAQVKVIFSNDGGASFGNPVKLDEGNAVGRVDIELLNENKAIVSWLEGENIVAAMVSTNGEVIQRYNIATTSQSRGSGFPQIAIHNNKLMVAWTDVDSKSIKMGYLNMLN